MIPYLPPPNSKGAEFGGAAPGNSTKAGDTLIRGPGWQAALPDGLKQIISPNNMVLLIGRVLVESDNELATACGFEKQIGLTALSQWQLGQYHSTARIPSVITLGKERPISFPFGV